MGSSAWIQLALLIAALAVSTPVLGIYLAKVFGGGPAPGDRLFAPVERLLYRSAQVDPRREQRWPGYATALLAFSAVSVVGLYGLQRLQGLLPLNPTGQVSVPAPMAFNTAVSFVTNTNWQSYTPEQTMATLTQMTGLAVQNFVSAAVGLAVAVALIRGLVRSRSATVGNFWVDLTRGVLRVLLPLSLVVATVLVSRGVVQNLSGGRPVTTLEGSTQVVPGGMVASQEAIKEVGDNGGGYYNANSAHPFENPDGFTNLLEIWALLAIPFALTFAFGRLVGDARGDRTAGARQGAAVLTAMVVLWLTPAVFAMVAESHGNPLLKPAGVDQSATVTQSGGNLEGKEVRFGPAVSGLFAASTTGTSTGAVDSMHDSYTPLGGAVPLAEMMLGEVSPGGVGAGLYGMLVFALLAVFIAGLMVGRTPEYLGKKVQAAEMKLAVLYILFVPLFVLGFSAASVMLAGPLSSLANPGPHGLTEVVYAYTSAGNNNGSAFAGLAAGTDWYTVTLGLGMLIGRFFLIVPVLAIAGSLAAKQAVPASSGTFPTGTPLFATLLTGVVVIVVGLTYFPVIALGPVLEHVAAGF
jgi:K+-transporting ATPase ATPase A chain